MAAQNELFSTFSRRGFDCEGAYCFGTYKDYAVTLQKFTAKSYYVYVAVRLADRPAKVGKLLQKSLRGEKIRNQRITKNVLLFSLHVPKGEEAAAAIAEKLDAITTALRENGIAPADTCAISGASRPESLCLTPLDGLVSFQPVCAAAIRSRSEQTRESVEENQENGSYALGFVGALIGMLVGLIPNLLTILFADHIYALLFALVPIASMFGYKLFKGKMSKGAMVIVILLSLVGVLLIPFLELVFLFVKEYGASVGQAVPVAAQLMTAPEFLSEIVGELLQLLLFMALGILVAWRYMSGNVNSNVVRGTEIQLATLRPNPVYQKSTAE